MDLLRNSSGLLLPIGSGRLGRAEDPETHITRLNHFGQGMGIDLSSTHPQFSSKSIRSLKAGSYKAFGNVLFDSHDEGLEPSEGHIANVRPLINEMLPKDDSPSFFDVWDELSHRSPYHHQTHINEDGDVAGTSYKETSASSYDPEDGNRRPIDSSWNGGPSNFKDSMKGISRSFQDFNRNREHPGANVSRMANRLINTNEISYHGRSLLRNSPHYFGPQFLHVGVSDNDDSRDLDDQIDLKTGNWAKLDPKGYLPD